MWGAFGTHGKMRTFFKENPKGKQPFADL